MAQGVRLRLHSSLIIAVMWHQKVILHHVKNTPYCRSLFATASEILMWWILYLNESIFPWHWEACHPSVPFCLIKPLCVTSPQADGIPSPPSPPDGWRPDEWLLRKLLSGEHSPQNSVTSFQQLSKSEDLWHEGQRLAELRLEKLLIQQSDLTDEETEASQD